MRKPAFGLGLVAGFLSLGVGLFGLGLGAAAASPGFQAASVIVPLLCLVAAAIMRIAPGLAALLLVGAIGELIAFGLSVITALPIAAALAAALLAATFAVTGRKADDHPK